MLLQRVFRMFWYWDHQLKWCHKKDVNLWKQTKRAKRRKIVKRVEPHGRVRAQDFQRRVCCECSLSETRVSQCTFRILCTPSFSSNKEIGCAVECHCWNMWRKCKKNLVEWKIAFSNASSCWGGEISIHTQGERDTTCFKWNCNQVDKLCNKKEYKRQEMPNSHDLFHFNITQNDWIWELTITYIDDHPQPQSQLKWLNIFHWQFVS